MTHVDEEHVVDGHRFAVRVYTCPCGQHRGNVLLSEFMTTNKTLMAAKEHHALASVRALCPAERMAVQ